VSTINLQEVDQLLVLGYQDLELVLDIRILARPEALRSLARGLLARKEANQLKNLRAILIDDVLGEVLHA
jgi:hypothetical protein